MPRAILKRSGEQLDPYLDQLRRRLPEEELSYINDFRYNLEKVLNYRSKLVQVGCPDSESDPLNAEFIRVDTALAELSTVLRRMTERSYL